MNLKDDGKKNAKNTYGKYWMFTINNPTSSADDLVKRYTDYKTVQAFVFQKEKGAEGTIHYQGYIEFKKSTPFDRVKRMVGFQAHIEKRKGTATEAIQYCTKEDTKIEGPWKNGEFTLITEQGNRTDLQAVVDTIKEAKSLTDVVVSHPKEALKYSKGLQFVYRHFKTPTTPQKPKVWLLYGDTGTGKTRFAMSHDRPFKKAGDDSWFDGYDNNDVLVMDDFAGGRSKMSLTALLNYLDRYPVKLPVKGDFVDRNCNLIIVTTNIHPQHWYDYNNREAHYKALQRRFTRVIYFNSKGAFQQNKDLFFSTVNEDTYSTSLMCRVVMPWESKKRKAIEEAENNPPGKTLRILTEIANMDAKETATELSQPFRPPRKIETGRSDDPISIESDESFDSDELEYLTDAQDPDAYLDYDLPEDESSSDY